MSRRILLLCLLLAGIALRGVAQVAVTVTGAANTSPSLAASYTDLASALTDVNAITAMTGPVTLTLAAGAETAPASGFVLGSASLNAVLSSTNTLTISATSATVVLNAPVGTSTPGSATPDGIFKITGADYVTISGITFTDGNAANPATMEFGIGLFKLGATDGAQNNIIQNCTFNMQRINNATGTSPMVEGSVGILIINSTATTATTAITPTAASGTNSNNKIYGNTINGGNYGIVLSGYAATVGYPLPPLGDVNNDIGGAGSASATTGNTILNFGGGAATNPAAAIRALNQWGLNISNNTINNNNGSGVNHATTLRGIYGQSGASANVTISYNRITLKSSGTTSVMTAIENVIGATAASNTVTITNNIIENCGYTTATTATFTGILAGASAANQIVNNNSIINNTLGNAGTASAAIFQGIYASASSTNFTANQNVITNNAVLNNFGTMYCIRASTSTLNYDQNLIVNNRIPNNTGATAATVYGFYDGSSPVNENYTNNVIDSLYITGSSTSTSNNVAGIYNLTAAGTKVFTGNKISNLYFSSSSTGYAFVSGIRNAYTTTSTIARNKIYNLSSTGATPTVSGLYLGSSTGTTFNVYNNLIGNLSTPASTGNNLHGIFCGSVGSINLSFNTVYLNTTSTGANFSSSAVYMSSTASTVTLRNNVLVNLSTPTGTGIAAAVRRTATAFTGYNTTSNNNNLYAGTPSATNVLYYDGTNAYQTMATLQPALTPREANSFSVAANFLSLSGAATGFLHIDPAISTQLESGGIPVAGITDDYDGDTRNTGTPDVGADEFIGISPAPSLSSLTIVPSTAQCVATSRNISVNASTFGLPITSVTLNYNNGAAGSVPMTLLSGTSTNGVWVGTIPAASPADATVSWSVTAADGVYTTQLNGSSYKDAYLANASTKVTSSAATICQGNAANLAVSTINGVNGTVTMGTATTTISGNDGNPYRSGNGTGNQIRIQLLYTAAELAAQGLAAGAITSIGLTTTSSTGTLANFSIALKQTSQSTLNTSFDNSGFTTVFTQASFTPAAGLNTHTFTTPFIWDGVSNLLVNFCQTNSVSGTSTVNAYTPAVSSNLNSAGTTTGCSATTGNLVAAKPILTFGGIVGTNYTSQINYTWNTSQTGANIAVLPAATASYYASGVDGNGCSVQSDTVTVSVNPLPTAPSATPGSQCGAGIPTASVASTAGVNGNGTFLWYDAPTGGTLLQGPAYGNALSTYYLNDFSSATLTNSSISGAAAIGSGVLTLQTAATSLQGGFTVNASGANATLYQTDFDLTLTATGTSMADGFSYSFADDALATTTTPTAEHGSGSKLRIGFFTYNAVGGSDGKGIYLMYNVSANSGYTSATAGVLAYSTDVSWIPTAAGSVTTHVTASINTAGQLTLMLGSTTIFNNVQLPAAFLSANKANWKHVFSSRSGGVAGGFGLDNVEIKTNNVVPGYTTYLSSVSATDTFYVSEMGVNGCESQRTPVIVNVTQPDAITASTSTSPACANSPVNLSVAQTGTTNTYVYTWTASPATGSGIPSGSVSGQNISVTPTAAGTYLYTVAAYDATLGCNTSSNVSVTVNGLPAAPAVTPASAQLCPGGIQMLTVNTVAQYDFGTQAAQNSASTTATGYPAPYTVYYGGQRMQMLITAAELTASGYKAGSQFTSVQFPVVSLGSNWGTTLTGLTDFQMSIGATSLTSISAFQTGLTQVVAPSVFVPVVGYTNTHTFGAPFTWDGTSNIILETTFSNNISGATNDLVTQYNSPTAYQSTIVYRADGVTSAAAAAATTVSFSYNARPDFKLNGTNPGATWSPASGLYTDASATIPYTSGTKDTLYAKPTTSTNYVATVTNAAGCTADTTTPVQVNGPSVAADASATTTCSGTSVNLNTYVLKEDFNGAANGWVAGNNSTGGTAANAAWTQQSSPYVYASSATFISNDNSSFYISNSDAQGSGGSTNTTLRSPSFSTVGMTSLNLDFYHYFRSLSDSAIVEASNDGVNWTIVQAFTSTQGSGSAFSPATVNLNSFIGYPSVSVRFRYHSAYGWYWALDNVKVSGISTHTFAWTSTPSGFSSSAQNPVGVTPTDTTTYTVVVTDGNSCMDSASVVVNVQPPIAGNTIGSSQTICSGSTPSALTGATPTGGNGSYQYTWELSTTGALSGYAPAPGVNNASGYVPGVLTADAWYRRVVVSGTCSDTSAVIAITVTPGITNNTIASSQSVCAGSIPAQLTGSAPSGAGGTYTYTWLSSTTSATTGYASAAGSNGNNDYTPGTATTTTWYKRVAMSGTCSDTSASLVISVSQPITGNTIASSQSICAGTVAAPLTGSITGLYEDFNGLTSTTGLTTATLPSGWTMTQNSGNLVTGYNGNSYGRAAPNGAIRVNNYSVGSGNVAKMDSKVFGPTVSGDSLRFDVAYGAYEDGFGPYVDTMRIYTSSGSGYTLLKEYRTGLNIDTLGDGINTAAFSTAGFAPTATQWTRKKVALPTGTTNVRFEFASGFGNRMYLDRVQADSASFTWLSSTTSAISGFAAASGTNTNSGYAPGAIAQTTWYKRVANTGTACGSDTSNTVVVNVSAPITGNTIGTAQTICSGSAPTPLTGSLAGINEDMNGITSTAGLTTAGLPAGWTMTLNQNNLVTGFNTNSYGRAGTAGAIRVDNYNVGVGNTAQMDTKAFGPSLSGDSLRFDIAYGGYDDAFGPYTDTLRIYTTNGGGYTLLKQYISGLVLDTSVNGITTANFTSSGFVPTATQWTNKRLALPLGTTHVRFEFASGFGNRMYLDRIQTDSAMFTWLASTTSASSGFATASGTNNATGYTPGVLTQSTWFKRVVAKGSVCSSDTSAAVLITVNPPIAGNTISASQTICSGTAPAPLTGSTPTGGSGTYTYQWQSSTSGATGGFSDIGGANAAGYTAGTLSATTWFRRVVTGGACAGDTSVAVQISVNPGVLVTTQPPATVSLCATNTLQLNIAATNATGYQWYKGVTALSNGGNISGASSNSLILTNATTSDAGSYTVQMTAAAGCSTITSNASTVTVGSLGSSLAANGATNTYVHSDGNTNTYTDASCNPILKIVDASGGNVLGSVVATVGVTGTVQTAPNGQKYLQRSYTVTPTSNGGATVTLYALQSEFTAYNAAPGAYPQMPVTGSNSDPNISNIRVTKYSGSPFAGGTNALLITPTSVNWNSTNNWWEITFPVSSFSSFYIHTGNIGPLDIRLLKISAVNVDSKNRVDWISAEHSDAIRYEVERSMDGDHFNYIGTVPASGTTTAYSLWDEQPLEGINYYRLKMYDAAERFVYSEVVSAVVKQSTTFGVEAYPNPVTDRLTVRVNGKRADHAYILITDVTGKVLSQQPADAAVNNCDMSGLAQGVYFVKYIDDKHSKTIKLNKQ